MNQSRIEALQGFLEEDPGDSFSRYALAMEFAKLGDLERAIREFETNIQNDPDYVATYYQLAKAYERAGREDDARNRYRDGIAVATRLGDNHTREELTAALEFLDS
jgi:Tfp pilus assembly protein PilF